ncbi:hypothetical protein Sm713_68440 [Streptomyces sp. TS71-3]|nr:hypothetical protein Sm713_68440 [Streptomyces sp. TS71-3]
MWWVHVGSTPNHHSRALPCVPTVMCSGTRMRWSRDTGLITNDRAVPPPSPFRVPGRLTELPAGSYGRTQRTSHASRCVAYLTTTPSGFRLHMFPHMIFIIEIWSEGRRGRVGDAGDQHVAVGPFDLRVYRSA